MFKIDKPSSDYFKYFYAENTSSLAILYNADHSQGSQQVLWAINPHQQAVSFYLDGLNENAFYQIADTERVQLNGLEPPQTPWQNDSCTLPALSCAIWVSNNR